MIKRRLRILMAVCLSLILLLSSGLIGGCSSGFSATQTLVRGWVSAEGPVSGANLAFYDVNGKQVYKTDEPVTGDLGSFVIIVKKLPANFRVVASGGNIYGQVFPAELAADYRGFDPETGMIYINSVTTMVSTYLDKCPDKTLDEATLIVKSYLEIPEWLDIGSGLKASEEYFSHNIFIEEADNYGGVSQYIDQLVADMDDDITGVTHPFFGEVESNNLIGGGTIAIWLAQGAMQRAGGDIFSWGLSEIGIGSGNDNAIKEIKNKLNYVSLQLDGLSTQMRQMENKLVAEIEESKYTTLSGQLRENITQIISIKGDLVTHYALPKTTSKSVLNASRVDIMKLVESRLLGNESLIHNTLMPQGPGEPGLLKIWSQVVKSKHRFLSDADSALIRPQFDYFDRIQQWLLEILVEYYHALAIEAENNDDSELYEHYKGKADTAFEDYKEHSKAQIELLKPSIPEGVYFDRDQNLMIWLPDNYSPMTFTMNGCISFTEDMRDSQKFGFSDWRVPVRKEIINMFTGWDGSTCWQKARSLGFSCIGDGSFFGYLSDDYNKWDEQDDWWGIPGSGWGWLYTKDGGINDSRNDNMKEVAYNVQIMPVRNMRIGLNELDEYFW